jgi:hypothetical protein
MEICVDIQPERLCKLDRAAQTNGIMRNTARREAIAARLAQARRDAVLSKVFDSESSGADRSALRTSLTHVVKYDNIKSVA